MLVLSVVAKVAWPSPTKRSTWHITNILSVAALRRDGGAGRDPTSEQPSVIRLPRTPRSARDATTPVGSGYHLRNDDGVRSHELVMPFWGDIVGWGSVDQTRPARTPRLVAA
jgi:hypothetical protein